MNAETAKRDLVLTAALSLLMEQDGLLTLERVSMKSGVSLDTLSQHFPTEESLVEAVLETLVKQFNMIARQTTASAEIGTRQEAEAYIEGSLDPIMRDAAASVARTIVRMYGPELRKDTSFLRPWREMIASRLDPFRQAQDLDAFAKAAVLVLAIESFTLMDVFNLYDFSPQELDAVKAKLLKL